MAKFLASTKSVSFSSFSYHSKRTFASTINEPIIHVSQVCPPKLPHLNQGLVAKLNLNKNTQSSSTPIIPSNHIKDDPLHINSSKIDDQDQTCTMEISKLHLIMEIIADRVEMHKNIGSQRDNWNHLLLTSVNMMTLSAATMAAIAAISIGTNNNTPFLALKVSSAVLYTAATGILMVMNKIQPSQLAEEQRNAARLFKQLHRDLKTRLSHGDPSEEDVNEAIEKVLALDKAYPLPLLGSMLEKFPKRAEPARWWPPLMKPKHSRKLKGESEFESALEAVSTFSTEQCLEQDCLQWRIPVENRKIQKGGWDERLEGEMKEVARVIKRKDIAEYLRLGDKVLNFHKVLAVSGPLLTGMAAIGSAFMGVGLSWGVMMGVIGGALASVVNTIEHGGQVGMVFEIYRGASGILKLMEETIEMNLKEQEVENRENGELLEIKVALQLGRSVTELRQFPALSDRDRKACNEEFASKLF